MSLGLPNAGNGGQVGDGNLSAPTLFLYGPPKTVPAGDATLTVDQLTGKILRGFPGSSAAAYTLPKIDLLEAVVNIPKPYIGFELTVENVDGASGGVITMTAGTGWTINGLATIDAVAGTCATFIAYKTGVGTWTLQRK